MEYQYCRLMVLKTSTARSAIKKRIFRVWPFRRRKTTETAIAMNISGLKHAEARFHAQSLLRKILLSPLQALNVNHCSKSLCAGVICAIHLQSMHTAKLIIFALRSALNPYNIMPERAVTTKCAVSGLAQNLSPNLASNFYLDASGRDYHL